MKQSTTIKIKLNGVSKHPTHSIPKNWKWKSLLELGSFSKGKGILKEQVIESGLPCIRYGEIYTTHDFILKEFKSFISEDVAAESKEIKNGDILFAGSGETLEEIGKAVAYVGNEKAYAGGDVIILSTKENVNTEWLSYVLEAGIVRRQKRRLGQGQSVVHIYPSDLATLKIPYPPEQEQKSISNLLDLIEIGISKVNSIIAKKELQKKWLMQRLLSGKQKLKGFEKEKWKEIILGENAVMRSGGTPLSTNKDFYDGTIPWVVIADITKTEKYILKTEKNITETGLQNSSAKKFSVGTILFAMYASIGKCAITGVELTCNQAILGIQPKNINVEFLYYLLSMNEDKYLKMGQSGAQSNLNKEIVSNFRFKIPETIDAQTAIALVLQAADKEIQLLKTKTEKLREQKKGLMQKLLTGKIRVN